MTSIFIRISSDWGVKLKLFKVLGIIFFIAPDTFQNDGFVSESRRGKKNDFNEWQYFYFFSESFDDLAPKKRWICNQYQINFVEPNFYFSVPGRYFGHDDSSWYGCNRDRVDKVSFHSSGGGASNLYTESRCGSKPTRKQIYMG